jgi:hypothetical protein
MNLEFGSPLSTTEMSNLLDELRRFRLTGELQRAKTRIEAALSREPRDKYQPIADITLLELHATSSAIYDRLGQYDEARDFVLRWASEIQFQVVEFRNEVDKASHDQIKSKEELRFPGDAMTWDERSFWHVRGVFLQQCGVAMYRVSKFDAAREYLKDALWLSSLLLERMRRTVESPAEQPLRSPQEIITTYANNCYWLGCVETYTNELDEAEKYFLSGLRAVADEFECERKIAHDHDIVRCNRATGRLLLGLGLVRFHKGAMTQAKSDLLAAKVLFSGDPGENIHRLRAELLLLSVDRTESGEDKTKLKQTLKALQVLSERFSGKGSDDSALVTRHERYYARTKWTIGKTMLDLSDLYRRSSDPVGTVSEEAEKERIKLLEATLEIAESDSLRAHGSQSDQLQFDILRIRALRRLERFEKAVVFGRFVINRPGTQGHSLLHTEVLISLGHACYNFWKSRKQSEHLLEAKKLISEAAEKCSKNPRAQAICKLHLARIAHAQGEDNVAEKEFAASTYLAGVIDKVKQVEVFSRRVERELNSGSADPLIFKITDTPDSNAYHALERQLRRYLMERVAAGMNNKDAAAAKLGVSRQTLYTWAQELKDEDNASEPKRPQTGKKHRGLKKGPSSGRSLVREL